MIQDNPTRWNSLFTALTRALNVRERLKRFVRTHEPPDNAKWRPQTITPNDWLYYERLHTCLETFYAATMTTQGFKPLLYDYFITLHTLLNELYNWRVLALDEMGDTELATAIHAAWLKVEKYYAAIDNTPVYYAAVMLNPTLKAHYFYQIWTADSQSGWTAVTIQKVRDMWRIGYKPPPPPVTTTSRNNDDDTPMARFAKARRLNQSDRQLQPLVDQFEQYITSDPVAVEDNTHFDVIKWWIERRYTTPELASFALDVLATPVMSDDNERTFSAAKDMITDRRNSLKEDVIEACQCLKSWYSPGTAPPPGAAGEVNESDDSDKDGEVQEGDQTGDETITFT